MLLVNQGKWFKDNDRYPFSKDRSMGHMKPVWFEADITEQDYLDSLSWVAERYKDDDTIIAYDLKNEPHGKPNESPRAIWNDSKILKIGSMLQKKLLMQFFQKILTFLF